MEESNKVFFGLGNNDKLDMLTNEGISRSAGAVFKRTQDRLFTATSTLSQIVSDTQSRMSTLSSVSKSYTELFRQLLQAIKQLQTTNMDYLHLLDNFKLPTILNVIQLNSKASNGALPLTVTEALNLLTDMAKMGDKSLSQNVDVPKLLEDHSEGVTLPTIDARMQDSGASNPKLIPIIDHNQIGDRILSKSPNPV